MSELSDMRLRAALEILGVGVSDRGRRFVIHRARHTGVDFSEQLLVTCVPRRGALFTITGTQPSPA